jgi:hypothetical protein
LLSFLTELRHRPCDDDDEMLKTDHEHVASIYNMTDIRNGLLLFQEKQLFWTKEDRFGFTMRGVQTGDAICVLDGAEVPHVLRKVDATGAEDMWRFVGDAFIAGLMRGEADGMDVVERNFCIV